MDKPQTKEDRTLLSTLENFVPIGVRANLYDASDNTNTVVIVTDGATIGKIWGFVREHARNPTDGVIVPAVGDIFFDFVDSDGIRFGVAYDSHGNFVIGNRIRGTLSRGQADELWRSLEPSLRKRL